MGKKNMPLVLASIICVVSIVIMIAVLLFSSGNSEPAAFTPPPFDENAIQGVPNVPEDLGWNELDVQAYKVSVCGVIIPSGNIADIWLTNPESNIAWLKLRVLDSYGNILGETGLIKPGEYVQSVTLTEVPKAGSQIGLKIMAYQPDTYYSEGSATLNTTISEGGAR